ncbi:hypothetical protein MC885_021897 [Smutsia gigantea]|nr:hypothetical protein MC885_021897 [Smutsia gigantea]
MLTTTNPSHNPTGRVLPAPVPTHRESTAVLVLALRLSATLAPASGWPLLPLFLFPRRAPLFDWLIESARFPFSLRDALLFPVKPCVLDQENQDPRRFVRKLCVQRTLQESAGPLPEDTSQTEKSEKLVGSIQLWNPLEELRPSPGGQNEGPRPPPWTEASGVIEFVADPASLATILSGCPRLCISGPQNPHPPTGP